MADKTTLAESAQALFCSLADYLGANESAKRLDVNKYKTFQEFLSDSQNKQDLITAYDKKKRVNIDADIKDVYKFLEDTKNGWYKSSVLIANKLVQDLKKIDKDYNINAKGFDYFYLRGKVGVMKDIQSLFDIAKKSDPTKLAEKEIPQFIGFKDINKWNPADIYLANKEGIKGIADELVEANKNKTSYSFDYLNEKIKNLMDKGALLPLSLKKTSSTVQLVKVNFSEEDKGKVLKGVNFLETTNWQPYKMLGKTREDSFDNLSAGIGGKTATRDIRIALSAEDNKRGDIKIRHDPSGEGNTGRFVIELIMKGDDAKGGSIASEIAFFSLWNIIDSVSANAFIKGYESGGKYGGKGVKEFARLKSIYLKDKELLRAIKNPSKGDKSKYDHYLAIASATNIINEIMPIIKEWFNKNNTGDKGNTNKLVRLLFQIATSRSPLSSRFVIAK
jgi:hypothetical protein